MKLSSCKLVLYLSLIWLININVVDIASSQVSGRNSPPPQAEKILFDGKCTWNGNTGTQTGPYPAFRGVFVGCTPNGECCYQRTPIGSSEDDGLGGQFTCIKWVEGGTHKVTTYKKKPKNLKVNT